VTKTDEQVSKALESGRSWYG